MENEGNKLIKKGDDIPELPTYTDPVMEVTIEEEETPLRNFEESKEEEVPLREMASRDESDDAEGVVYFDEEAVALRKVSNEEDIIIAIDDGEVPLRQMENYLNTIPERSPKKLDFISQYSSI